MPTPRKGAGVPSSRWVPRLIKFPPELDRKLTAVAAHNNMAVTALVRLIVHNELDRIIKGSQRVAPDQEGTPDNGDA